MNKKAYILILLALVLIPIVTATIGEGIDDALSLIFGATGDLAYIKAGVWVIVFIMVFRSAERIFPTSRGTAAVISLVFSVLAARFIPDEYLGHLGWWFLVIIIIGLPYFLGSFLGDLARLGRGGKTFLILIFYGIVSYSFIRWRDLGLEGPASDILDTALTWMSEHTVMVLIVIAVLCIFFLFKSGRSGAGPTARPPGGGGPSFWQGLGRGAGASARWANVRYRWLRRRLYRQRLAAEQARRQQPLPPGRQIGWFRGGIR